MILLILAIICNLIPLILLLVFYNIAPDVIPAFVDLLGRPTFSMEKTYISILRLPMMGLLLTSICLIMYTDKPLADKSSDDNEKSIKVIWPVMAIIISLKTGITSLEMLFSGDELIVNYFRISILALVVIGVTIMTIWLFKNYKDKQFFTEFKTDFTRSKLIFMAGLLIAYVLIVFMPYYLPLINS